MKWIKKDEQTKFVTTVLNVVVASGMSIALTGCAAKNPDANSTDTPEVLDLTGNWKEIEPEEKQWYEATIDEESITVYQVDSKEATVIWNGTYVTPETGDTWTWTSESLEATEESKEKDSKETEKLGSKETADADKKSEEAETKDEEKADLKESVEFSYSEGVLSFELAGDKESEKVEMEKVELFDYSTAEEFEIKDKDGKVTGKYSVLTVNKADVTSNALEDWYNTYVADGDYDYAVIKFAEEEGKGVYADTKNVYVNTDLVEEKDGGYTQPESDPTYVVEEGKIDVTQEKSEINSNDKTDDTDKSEDKETDKKDETREDDSKESASTNSGKGSSSNSNTSKPSGNSNTGTSNSSKPSGSTSTKPSNNTGTSSGGNQSTNTKPTDPNAGKTKVWVVDTPAWDETVVVTPAWTENVTVVDTPAWDEVIPGQPLYDVTICNLCGAEFTGPNQINDWGYHAMTVCASGGYHTDTIYSDPQVVHHEAVTHVEQIYHEAVTQVIHHDEVGHWEWQ